MINYQKLSPIKSLFCGRIVDRSHQLHTLPYRILTVHLIQSPFANFFHLYSLWFIPFRVYLMFVVEGHAPSGIGPVVTCGYFLSVRGKPDVAFWGSHWRLYQLLVRFLDIVVIWDLLWYEEWIPVSVADVLLEQVYLLEGIMKLHISFMFASFLNVISTLYIVFSL